MSTVLRFRISFEQKLLLGLDSETIIDSLVDKLNMLKSLHICGNNYDSLYAILYLDVQLPDENPKEAEFRILDLLSEPDLLRYSQFFRQDYDDWESESYG